VGYASCKPADTLLLFLCTVTDFSVTEKNSGVKLCMRVRLVSGQVFSHFGEIWPWGSSPRSIYAKVTWEKNLTWDETLAARAARLIGCHGLAGHSELAATACTEARHRIRNWARCTKLGGHSELGAAALLKAVWCDFRLGNGHVYCLFTFYDMMHYSA